MNNWTEARLATDSYNCGMIDEREWAKRVLGEDEYNTYSVDYLKRGIRIFTLALDNMVGNDCTDSVIDEKEALILERKKLQTVNLQAQEYYRERGRSELLREQIREAIQSLEPINFKHYTYPVNTEDNVGLLVIADCHYDSNYDITGPDGTSICSYNTYTFKSRMNYLADSMAGDSFDYSSLKVVFCGDDLENLIRASSLKKLRQSVVKSTIEFAEFVSEWLNDLSELLEVPIEVAFVPGNHTVCRLLGQKPEFEDENLEYIIHAFVELRLKDNQNITVAPYNNVYYTQIHNENMLFAHGEDKDLEKTMKFYENFYGVRLDACYGAHFHSESTKSIGVGTVGSKRIIRVPSIVGTDPYALKLGKNNRAGAYFAIFNDDGEWLNKIYWLN